MRVCPVSHIQASLADHFASKLDCLGRPVYPAIRRIALPPYLARLDAARYPAPTPPEAAGAIGRALEDARRDEEQDAALWAPSGFVGMEFCDRGEFGDGSESELERD